MTIPLLPGRTFDRLRRCQNCAHFRTGPAVTEDVCRQFNLIDPAKYPHLVLGTINKGLEDQALDQTNRGMAGRCAIGASTGDITSALYLCDKHEAALGGIDRIGGSGDLSIEEVKEKLGLDS